MATTIFYFLGISFLIGFFIYRFFTAPNPGKFNEFIIDFRANAEVSPYYKSDKEVEGEEYYFHRFEFLYKGKKIFFDMKLYINEQWEKNGRKTRSYVISYKFLLKNAKLKVFPLLQLIRDYPIVNHIVPATVNYDWTADKKLRVICEHHDGDDKSKIKEYVTKFLSPAVIAKMKSSEVHTVLSVEKEGVFVTVPKLISDQEDLKGIFDMMIDVYEKIDLIDADQLIY